MMCVGILELGNGSMPVKQACKKTDLPSLARGKIQSIRLPGLPYIVGDVWMPKTFNVRVRASALGFFSENSDESDTYLDYQPMPQALAELQSTK